MEPQPLNSADDDNPYQSPQSAADSRRRWGWLVLLVILWPIVMGATGSILGFFAGRLSFNGISDEVWNQRHGALFGALLFAIFGVWIGVRKASRLSARLNEIHERREQIRQDLRRRMEAS